MNRDRTDTRSTKRADPPGTGNRDEPFPVGAPRRRVQVPQLLIAVFLVAASALAAVVLVSQAAAREPILTPTTVPG